jgi:hypothetical protein
MKCMLFYWMYSENNYVATKIRGERKKNNQSSYISNMLSFYQSIWIQYSMNDSNTIDINILNCTVIS